MAEPSVSISASALLAMLRREGGWWTPTQLLMHWQPTWSRHELELLLAELRRAGWLVQRQSLASAQVHSFSARPTPRLLPDPASIRQSPAHHPSQGATHA